jgi:CHAD domain-containing protein
MAKAREISGLAADAPYGSAAAQILAVRSEEVVEHSQDVLDVSDIERVHDMRVATRRLRAAIEICEPCFPKKAFKSTLGEVKEIADALGERRDRDVTIAALERFAAEMPAPDRPGIESLVKGLRSEQEHANEALVPFVASDRLERLRASLAELTAEAESRVAEE